VSPAAPEIGVMPAAPVEPPVPAAPDEPACPLVEIRERNASGPLHWIDKATNASAGNACQKRIS
jgi:hypothetical protein